MIPTPRAPKDKPNLGVEKIKFRLRYVRTKGKYSCPSLSKAQKREVLGKLRHYGQMTVVQFRANSSVRLKSIQGKVPTPPADLSEDIVFQEFRVSRRFRVMGFLLDDEFFLIWFDPDHDSLK